MSYHKILQSIRKINFLPLAKLLALAFPAALIAGPAYADITGSAVAVLFLLNAALKNEWHFLREFWVRFGAAFWILQLSSTLWAQDKHMAFVAALGWGRFLFWGLALGYWVLQDRVMLRRFFIGMSLCLAFLSADGLYQQQTGVDILGHKKYNQYANTDNDGNIKTGDRLTGPFNNPILGAVVIYLLFPSVLYAAYADRRRSMLLFGCISFCGMLAVLLSGERSQLLLLMLGLCLLAAHFISKKRFALLLKSVLLSGVLLAVSLVLIKRYEPEGADYIKNRQIISTWHVISDYTHSPYGRIWKDALLLISQHPLLGVGEGNVRVHWCIMKEQRYFTEGCPLHPHNVYLEVAANTGLIGFTLYVLMLGALLRYFLSHYGSWKNDPMLLGIFITLCLRIWPFITVTSYARAISSQTFWLMVGWGIAALHQKLQERPTLSS